MDGAVLILIFAVSGALEGFATQRTERNIRDLMAAAPDVARVVQGRQEQHIAVNQVQVGNLVLVKPGELIPLDGRIIEGQSSVNQAPITGESMPIDKAAGDEVFAGSLNGSGALTIQVEKPPASSLIQRIIRLVEQAQTTAPPSQQFIERFERSYARFIVVTGSLLAVLLPEAEDLAPGSQAGDEGLATTQVWVGVDGAISGQILLADSLRPEAQGIVKKLKDQGIDRVVMLTGDNQQAAQAVAQALGIDEVFAELLPEQKLTAIRQLQATCGEVAMVGDGNNDAPALADVGIALGGVSTDVALETADIILMANRLDKLSLAIRQGRCANRVIKQNIAFALRFIGVLLLANFIGSINMPEGVIGHEGSTLIVTLSGLRLLK
jgi:cation transport ATPase